MTRVIDIHKRQPLLVDKWLAVANDDKLRKYDRKFVDTTRDNLRFAKRFVLDDQATRYCAEIVRDAPRIIADAQDFAIPPFHRTYIEVPYSTWFRTITGREPDRNGDTRVGYLYVGNTVRMLSESHDEFGPPGIVPIEYELWHPFTMIEELELVKQLHTSRAMLDVFFWGESTLKLMDVKCAGSGNPHNFEIPDAASREWQKAGLRALRANHRFRLVTPSWVKIVKSENPPIPPQQLWQLAMAGQSGDLRNAIALLLFLNRTQKIRVEREEPTLTNRMYKRKPIPLLRHRVITLHVDPKPRLLRLCAGEGIRRRLHDVRGHLCHNRIARESHHDHEWIEAEEGHMSEMQWFCECGALRWWRHEHQRGHGEKGIVTAEYKVVE